MSDYKWKPFTLLVSAEEVENTVGIKLEAGKYYKTRDGRKVGPMRELDREKTDWPWTDSEEDMPGNRYNDNGYEIGTYNQIISEWPSSSESPIREVTRRELVAGNYGKVAVTKSLKVFLPAANYTACELREAAHTLNQIAEYLEIEGK